MGRRESDGDGPIAVKATDEWVPLSSLTHWDRNPRRNDDAVDGVARSIIAFGWGAPRLAHLMRAERDVEAVWERWGSALLLRDALRVAVFAAGAYFCAPGSGAPC